MIVIDMVYFSFVCLLKLILYNSKPQNQMCDWNIKCFYFFDKNLKSSFLHDSHIWLWGFFTLLVALAHGAPSPRFRRPCSVLEVLGATTFFLRFAFPAPPHHHHLNILPCLCSNALSIKVHHILKFCSILQKQIIKSWKLRKNLEVWQFC